MLARFLALPVAGLTGVILFHPRDGMLQLLAWGPKLYASALAPQLALLGGWLAALGLKRRDPLTAGLGLFSAMVAAKHVADVTANRRAELDSLFGPGWEAGIPPDLRRRLRKWRWLPVYRRRRHGPLHRDVTYGVNSDSGRPLTADLLQPPPEIPRTGLAMIFVHGGGWWYGRKNIRKFPYFQRLVAQGHVVMDINYTLAPHSSVPGMVRDVKQAILWLKRHAAQFQIDPQKIVLTGQSAGAHLCLLAAFAPTHPAFQPHGVSGDASVRGVISYHGPPDMAARYNDIQTRFIRYVPNRIVGRIHRWIEAFGGYGDSLASGLSSVVGGAPEDIPQTYRLISPITHVSAGCPPTLLLQGTHDVLVDYREVEQLYRCLKQAGAPVGYISFPNCGHTFESILPRLSPPAQTAAWYVERFLAALV